jgi:hypothetical protein
MTEDRLFELIDPVLKGVGSVTELGEEYRTPALDVLRYYFRPVRLHWAPILGRASSVVAVVRQPFDSGFRADSYHLFLTRVARAVNGRFPPWNWRWPRPWLRLRGRDRSAAGGLVVGLTVVVLTPEPIGAEDDAMLGQVLAALSARRTRTRAVPLGLLRVNLGQEALAFALAAGPAGLFAEPELLADTLSTHFRRYVPFLPGDPG